MFENITNRIKWQSIINDPLTPPYMKDIINDILIPYRIKPDIFKINRECIDNCCEKSTTGILASPSVIQTVRDLNYKFSCIRCSSMPLWYYYAFPDVFLWTLSNDTKVKELLDELNKFEYDLLDVRGEVKPKYVKMFINAYLKYTNKNLECT